jgi:hypothetical protein
MHYSQWWANKWFGSDAPSLSILDLVNYGTIDCKLAGLLWHLMERRASVLVAAGPSFAGKTTFLHTLLDFLPIDIQQISLKGYYEDYQFLGHCRPDKTYLVAEEISNHGFAEYVWGVQAARVFKLMSQGYGLGGTIHSRSSEEAVYVLHKILGISLALISRLSVVVNLRVFAGRSDEDEPVRRVNSVDLILPHTEGLAVQVLAAQQYTEKGFEYQTEKALQQALATKHLIGNNCVSGEIDTKKRFLKHLLDAGKTSRKEVRQAVRDYYRSKT